MLSNFLKLKVLKYDIMTLKEILVINLLYVFTVYDAHIGQTRLICSLSNPIIAIFLKIRWKDATETAAKPCWQKKLQDLLCALTR